VRFAKYLFAVCLLLITSPSWAIVNVSDLHLKQPDPGFSAYVDLSLGGASGNTVKSDFTLGSRLQRFKAGKIDYLLMDYQYSEGLGTIYDHSYFLHYRHINPSKNKWQSEWFLQREFNANANLASRQLAGLGLRYTLSRIQDKRTFLLGSSLMYVSEDITGTGINSLWRGNFYFIAAWKPKKNLTISSSTYYQPALDNPSDFHILEQLSIKINVNDDTAIVLNLDIKEDSDPPAGVQARDIKYGTRLEFKI
jgi:hypothetical protein